MENDDSNSLNGNHSFQNEQDSNKSFVDKVKSRMTGILSSSFNKLFGNDGQPSLIRRRDDNEEDSYQLQPPSKRIKKSSPGDDLNNVNLNSVPVRKGVNNLYKAAVSNSQNRVQSTFAKPTPGPSGIKSRKTLADAITCNLNNDDKDSDSGESTSGYSSMARISHKDVTHSGESKKVETTVHNVNSHNLFNTSNLSGRTRSLFTERSLSPQMNSSLSSRRPCFSASTFGSPSFIDRTLSTKRITSSPFYSGRTMYGGASAYNTQQRKLNDSRVLSTPQIEVKSVANAEETVNAPLSKTARRILETLEGFTSTTLLDVQKIPSPRKIENSGLLSKYTGANPYSIKDRKSTHSVPTKELVVPRIPDMLQMKRKEKLQNTTESVRKIAVASNSSLNNDSYKIRSAEVDETSKHTNKFRNKISSVRHKPDNDNEVAEQVNLPNITLPITNLPTFDFTLPLPPSCLKPADSVSVNVPTKSSPAILLVIAKEPLTNNTKALPRESEKLQTKIDGVEYKFSNPEVLAENLKAITAINDFKFSDPVFKKLNQSPITSSTLLNFKSFEAPPLKLKKKLPNNQTSSVPKLFKGSVEDVLNKNEKDSLQSLEKFKPTVGMWECNTCLLRNFPDKQVCVACTAPKSVSKTKTHGNAAGFGDKFKMSSEQWECSVCMLRNDNLNTSCVACTTPRISNSKSTTSNIVTTPAVTNSFGSKFKPPKDTWECSTCMIRNQESAEKCIACETAKPGGVIKKNNSTLPAAGFGDLFQKKSNEWECSVCMVRNPNDKVKCLSCETPNPQASTSSSTELSQNTTPKKIPTFMFGIFPGSKTTGTGFKTDEKPSSDAVAKSSVPISSIFGNDKNSNLAVTSAPKTTSTFTFGVPKAEVKKANSDEKSQVSESKIVTPISLTTFNNKSANIAESTKPLNSIKNSQQGTKTTFAFGSSSSNTQSTKASEKPENANKIVNSEKVNENSASKTLGFTFGSHVSPIDKEKSANQTSGTFGSSSGKEKSAQPTGFTFGSSAPLTLKRSSNHIDEHDSPSTKRSSLPAPTFSPAQKIANDKNDADILKKAMSIGKESTKKVENNLFSTLATSNISSGNTSTNSFGFMPSQTQQSTLPTTTSESSNLFSFGSKTSTVEFGKAASKETPLFKIGSTGIVKLPEKNKTTFDVTTVAPSTISSNVFTNTSTSLVFGASSSKSTFETTSPPSFETTQAASSKQLFEPLSKPTFDNTTNKPLFKLDQTAFKTPNKIFDTPSKSFFDNPNKTPIFDSPSSTSSFGSTTTTNFGSSTSEIKPFSFGGNSTSDNVTIKPPAFSFGPSTDSKVPEASQPPPPVFGFGSSAGTSSSSNTFSFNSTTATSNFNFNSPKVDSTLPPFQSSTPASNLFGSSSQAQPVQNGGFNFGSQSSSNAVKTGFNFGTAPPAPTQFNAPPAASGSFSFGSSNQNNAQPATGGFNFGAMAAPPTFNTNVPPAFNFTGGATPTFSAQPPSGDGLGPLPTRKKIKAVRRTLQR